MTELKTLKDVPTYPEVLDGITEDDLRQAAREWIESYEKDKEIVGKPFYMRHIRNKDALLLRNQIICNWIKYFFNLEDE